MNIKNHKKKCKICNSPQRKEFEEDYIAGLSLRELELKYADFNTQNMWNHLRAFPKIRERRAGNLDGIVDRVIENGSIQHMKIDVHALLKAITLRAKLAGRLDTGSKSGDTNVSVSIAIQQEGKEEIKNNRMKAYDLLRYSDN